MTATLRQAAGELFVGSLLSGTCAELAGFTAILGVPAVGVAAAGPAVLSGYPNPDSAASR